MTKINSRACEKEETMDQVQLAYRVGEWFNRVLFSYYRATFKGNLGAVQVQALSDLYILGSARMQEMADRLDVPKQHASKILARLGETGLVESRPDPDDGRARIFSLTPEGKALVEEHIEKSNSRFREMLATLSEEDRRELGGSMEKLLEIFGRLQ